jgi:hypothetical protein
LLAASDGLLTGSHAENPLTFEGFKGIALGIMEALFFAKEFGPIHGGQIVQGLHIAS